MGARADTASEAEVNAFYEWAGELYPAKSLVTTMAHGRGLHSSTFRLNSNTICWIRWVHYFPPVY